MNKVQTSVLQYGQRRATVEPQGLSAGHSWYPNRPPAAASPETQGRSELAPASLWRGRFDFFARIGAWKEGA